MSSWEKKAVERVRRIVLYLVTFVKWIAIGALVGVVGGFVGALFHLGVDSGAHYRAQHSWVLYLLPLGGLVITALYKLCRVEGRDTNAIIESVHFGSRVPVLLVPVIFLSTVITHLLGGSAGREGAALQIGGGIGYKTGTLLRLHEKDLPLCTLCGMSGVFAALFGTPLTAVIFSLAVAGTAVPWAWLIKLLFTAVTMAVGFKGGEVVPSFFIGATFGCTVGGLLGLSPALGAAVGLVAVFCGAVNCPVASVFLAMELFGGVNLPYFAVACAISYMLSGYSGLYGSQRILYSKLRAEYVNHPAT